MMIAVTAMITTVIIALKLLLAIMFFAASSSPSPNACAKSPVYHLALTLSQKVLMLNLLKNLFIDLSEV